MLQRDYLMRMIEQVGEAVGQVLGLRQRKEQLEALKVIDDLFDRQLRLKASLIRTLSEEDLVKLLTTNGVVDTVSLQAIARMLSEEGLSHEEVGDELLAYKRSVKSLELHLSLALMEAEPVITDSAAEIERLLERLRPYELTIRGKQLLAAWRETQGQYDQAENWLHELVMDGDRSNDELAAFYYRLKQLTDEQLADGGLTRDEVNAGLMELRTEGMRE